MARPIKQGADWFKHDKDMRNDPKVKALRRKFGLPGYAVYCMTIEIMIDSEGFTTVENPLQVELSAGDMGVEPGELTTILDYCVEIGLFQRDKNTSGDSTVLSSRRLKLDMQVVIDGRNSENESYRRRKYTEQSRVEKSREEQLAARAPTRGATPDATPPAAALSLTALKKRLADAVILTTPAELEKIMAQLIAQSADCDAFVSWALAKAAKARNPSSWFVRGLLEWDWVGKWRENGAPAKPAEPAPYMPIEPHIATAEDDAEVERLAAETRARLHMVDPPAEGEGAKNELDAIEF